jgi:uncharacterized membrane protein
VTPSTSTPPAAARRRQWYTPRSVVRSIALRPKVYVAVLAAVATALALPAGLSTATRAAMAGDVGALVYLAFSLRLMVTHTSESIRKRAAHQDDGAIVILVLTLVAIALAFYTIFGVLAEARQTGGQPKALLILLAAATILLSWLVTQVAFTFHYAHEHYRPEDRAPKGGLEFPDDDRPDYWDFFYFATSIGAASQTSDTMIRSKHLRRLVTLHAVISFFFNAAVLALAINIGASLI